MRLDCGYQNGVRGFIYSVSLRRDFPQAKALAYAAECVHARDASAESSAVTEKVTVAPQGSKPRRSECLRLG